MKMLKDDFYTIPKYSFGSNSAHFVIWLKKEHTLFQAHFPNNPIVPGVYIVQIGKELFSFLQKKNFIVKNIKNIKFTNPIVPSVHSEVFYKMTWENIDENDLYHLKIEVSSGNTLFSKISMQLKEFNY